MEQIKKLLEQVSMTTKRHAEDIERLDATGGRFNMFRVCGVDHYENTHSAILAEFLNPNGSHGLRSKLLECFIETIGSDFIKKNFDCANAHVHREYDTGNGRLDILIEDNQNHAVIVENKIYAADQQEQIERYAEFAEKKYGKGNYQILYLTLFGRDASEQSGGDIDDYTTASYKEDIIKWLEQCVPIAVRHPMVRETINQYINHLKQLTHQDMDTKNREEIIDMIVGDKELMDSAHYIINIWSGCHWKTRVNVVNSVSNMLKEIAEKLKLVYEQDCEDLIENQSTFVLFRNEWQNNHCIRFWFEQKQGDDYELYIGVDQRALLSNKVRDALKIHMQDFKFKNYPSADNMEVWSIKWGNFKLWGILEKLSPVDVEEVIRAILEKLDGFKE
jgi:hypothetical protein